MAKLITLPGPPTSLNEGRRSCYIEPASLVEVMFDQLAWLLEHTSESCFSRMSALRAARKGQRSAARTISSLDRAASCTRSHCCMKHVRNKRS
jgi:hypothetical protein